MLNIKKNISINKLDREFNVLSQKIEEQTLPDGFRQFILYSLSELFANVKEHSEGSKATVSLVTKDNNFSLIVADNGIGFRESYLRKGIYSKDDFSAIQFALGGLSTKKLNERGFGLYTVRKFARELKGTMIIESGKASARIIKNKVEFVTISSKKGVKIILETPIKKVDFYKNIE